MSYAGPVSHGKRAPDATLPSSESSTAIPAGPSMKGFRPLPRYSTRQDRTAILAAGIALGFVLGAGAALLLAPQSGADTRHDIVRRGRRLKRRSRTAWDDLRFELGRLQRKSFKRRDASSL
jgi:YtxH-like protein